MGAFLEMAVTFTLVNLRIPPVHWCPQPSASSEVSHTISPGAEGGGGEGALSKAGVGLWESKKIILVFLALYTRNIPETL